MTFAYAYSQIPAGTGALLLFASIQISMILYGLIIGERLSFLQSIGVAFAVSGLVMLMLPSVGAPPLFYGFLMIVSGIAWSAYSVAGRGSQSGLGHRRQLHPRHADRPGAVLPAVPGLARGPGSHRRDLCGGFRRGDLGPGLHPLVRGAQELKVTHAATVQLSVPVLTAFGGALFLGEAVTQLLVAASALIILGVSLVVLVKRRT